MEVDMGVNTEPWAHPLLCRGTRASA